MIIVLTLFGSSFVTFAFKLTDLCSYFRKIRLRWCSFLTHCKHIKVYYHKHSLSAFRYLGFYMPYTIQQRNAIQTMLLEKLRSQIQIYSQRQLSLRGRATITNSLILSKIWYCLRLFVPTQRFLKDVRSMVYQYVWQKKFPYVSLDQLTLSHLQGGVGLLDPIKQYLRIQMKWIFTLFMTRRLTGSRYKPT